jgi:hypothetical protein
VSPRLAQERQTELFADSAPATIGTDEVLDMDSLFFESVTIDQVFLQMDYNVVLGLLERDELRAEFYNDPKAALEALTQNTFHCILIERKYCQLSDT